MDVIMDKFVKESHCYVQEFNGIITAQKDKLEEDGEETLDSESLRKEANELYRSKTKLQESLRLYTLSVKAAEADSENLVLALGNRSAVTFELRQYELCLRDISSALALCSTPVALHKKLLVRKARSLHHLQEFEKSRQACDEVIAISSQQGVNLTQSESECLTQLRQRLDEADRLSMPREESQCVYGSRHSTLPAASDVLEKKESASKGRYLQVNGDIPEGSVLLRELPYVAVLLPDYWSSHCYHCLRSVHFIPVYCRRRGCKVKYCTIECERNRYHQYECASLDTIVNTGIGHLAYRVVALTGCQRLLEHRAHLQKNKELTGHIKSYDAVYHLVTNSDHILPEDQHQYSKTALLLLMCLLDTKFFPGKDAKLTDPDVIYMGTLLLRHIQQLICNAHAITIVSSPECSDSERRVLSQTQDKLASAIYPTASLMNHSCKPNIIASFVGSSLTVKNSVPLQTGDEVFYCYGPHYQKMQRSERQQALLTQYFFTCDCEACAQETDHPSTQKCLCCVKCQGPSLLQSESKAKCQQCGTVYDATDQMQRLIQAKQFLEDARQAGPGEGLVLVKKAKSILLNNVVHKHSIDIANVYDQEAQYLATLGDMSSCAESLLSSITILELIYPEYSVERAHEYHKLSEVLCNTHQYAKALAYASKAKTIFEHQYSKSHDLVKEVDELCRQIEMTGMLCSQ